jgi:hypothetical protein
LRDTAATATAGHDNAVGQSIAALAYIGRSSAAVAADSVLAIDRATGCAAIKTGATTEAVARDSAFAAYEYCQLFSRRNRDCGFGQAAIAAHRISCDRAAGAARNDRNLRHA